VNPVTLSPKYQIVIPLQVRRALRLKPGQKFQVVVYNNHIHLVPVIPPRKLRGMLKGINTTIEREPDRV
jgi:AbrB family looped-hinge helix DNA binding protein